MSNEERGAMVDEFGKTFATACMTACAGLLKQKPASLRVQVEFIEGLGEKKYDLLCRALRRVIKRELPAMMSEWMNAIEANLGEPWLKQLVATQSFTIAEKSIVDLYETRGGR